MGKEVERDNGGIGPGEKIVGAPGSICSGQDSPRKELGV